MFSGCFSIWNEKHNGSSSIRITCVLKIIYFNFQWHWRNFQNMYTDGYATCLNVYLLSENNKV
jgi:hypothetical protein